MNETENIFFTVHKTDTNSRARTGTLHLPHGDVRTPVFMPVGTNGTVKAVTNRDLREIGFEIILANTYHLSLRPGTGVIAKFGGLHDFSRWNGNILTDSGGFQVFSLASLCAIDEAGARFRSHIDGSAQTLTPESVVDIQCVLNSDIQMQLDVCRPADVSEHDAKAALELTGRWLQRARTRWLQKKDDGYTGELFSIVQGGFFRHLRRQSAELCAESGTAGIAIGGLSVGEAPDVFCDFLSYTASLLPPEKPRYVMGIGTPRYILEAVENGIDMFDCVLPTRVARNGLALTHNGPVSIKKEIYKMDDSKLDTQCRCPVCSQYSRSYLRHLFKCGEILVSMLLSCHNLYFLNELVQKSREAIAEGRFVSFKNQFLSDYENR
ncbi:MAG: tRNA guanosine(34) transglycosylase Tgt [Spirochaetaceae bacterium]|jgi:queuine tRNA-ribosyltransferase|nr:tRNA guanosine(34) transglycosylase Tgt [Spirochaetaceae bacterium]